MITNIGCNSLLVEQNPNPTLRKVNSTSAIDFSGLLSVQATMPWKGFFLVFILKLLCLIVLKHVLTDQGKCFVGLVLWLCSTPLTSVQLHASTA